MLHLQHVVIYYTFNPPVFKNVLMLPPFNVCTALALTALCHGERSLSSEQHFPALQSVVYEIRHGPSPSGKSELPALVWQSDTEIDKMTNGHQH